MAKFIDKRTLSQSELDVLDPSYVKIREKMDNNFIFFMETIFPDRMTDRLSKKMRAAIEDTIATVNDVFKLARAFPRGFGKTTTWTLGFHLWMIVTKRIDYSVVVGASGLWISEQITNIQNELLNNELLRMYYGAFREGDKWTNTEFIVEGFLGDEKWQAKVLGLGRTGSVRGRLYKGRPKLVILDDIEKLEEVDNPALVEKTLRWVANTILKMGDRDTRFMWLGTVLEKDCAFDQVLKGELGFFGGRYSGVTQWSKHKNLWDEWGKLLNADIRSGDTKLAASGDFYKKHKKKMLDGAEVLWEEHRSYPYLMYQFYTEGALAFFKEIQNEPAAIKSDFFAPAIVPKPDISSLSRFIAIDPSLGKVTPSAIICFGFDLKGGKNAYVFDASIEKRGANELIQKVIYFMEKYDIHRYIVEVIQFQDLFKDILQENVKKAGINGIPIPFKSKEKKESRIEAMQPLINQSAILFTQNLVNNEFWNEITGYPYYKFKDGLDALGMGISHIKNQLVISTLPPSKGYVPGNILFSRAHIGTIKKKGAAQRLESMIRQKRAYEAEQLKNILGENSNGNSDDKESITNE